MAHIDDDPDVDFSVRCKHCSAPNLYWQDTYDAGGNRKPKLFEDGKPHVCAPDPDDFQVLA